MFTGIVEELGKVEEIIPKGTNLSLSLYAPKLSQELIVGSSIAVNGVCLTVVAKKQTSFEVEAIEETLKKTNLGQLSIGSNVNLELPLRVNERFDGHFVLGHVDCVGTISSIEQLSPSSLYAINVPDEYSHYLIPRGSIAVDGVSLTIAEIKNQYCIVAIIPHTFEHTLFRYYSIGSRVNLEFDIIGKYIERLMNKESESKRKHGITETHLRELGF
jgi:riboflavin synthase